MAAYSDLGERLLPYYYPCTYCPEEECGIDDKEDCEAFICWFIDYDKEEDCIICRKLQQCSEQARNLIQ
jgi:hypothetical protein